MRFAGLDDVGVSHYGDPPAQRASEADVVGDDHDRAAKLRLGAQGRCDAGPCVGVERRGRLVRDQQPRLR
ncbi:MAG: hypothetical protein ACOVQI_14550, partial [Tagaea sp.]